MKEVRPPGYELFKGTRSKVGHAPGPKTQSNSQRLSLLLLRQLVDPSTATAKLAEVTDRGLNCPQTQATVSAWP